MKPGRRIAGIIIFLMLLTMPQGIVRAAQPGAADTSATEETVEEAGAEDTTGTEEAGETEGGQTVITMVGKYDSADTAPIISVNETAQSITFKNHDTGRNYTLFYDNATRFTGASGMEFSPSSLKDGMLVDITFLKRTKHLNSLRTARGEDVWSYENQRNYTLPTTLSVAGPMVSSMATLNGARYLMDVRTLVLVEGEEASPAEIVEGDIISAVGVGHEVYCVMVTRGHGYVSLSSDTVGNTSLVGAWIELDNSVIRKITPNMLMTAPEGDYTLYIIGNGANYSAPVSIARGKETVVDTSRIAIEPPMEGRVRFDITPSDARIRVDGRLLAEDEESVSLEYGIHTIELTADGYESMLRYLRVGSASSVLRLEMTKDTSAAAASANTTTSATNATTSAANATTSATNATTASANATTSAANATTSAANATTSAANATTSATNATTASVNATTSATTATTPATNVTTSAVYATTSGNGGTPQGTEDHAGKNTNPDASHTGSTSEEHHQTQQEDQSNIQEGDHQPSGKPDEQQEQAAPAPGGRIHVDLPSGAVLYVDGNFIGYIPVSFDRTPGIHTVTLQQEGRRTISYNIEIEEGSGDKTFTFAPLDLE